MYININDTRDFKGGNTGSSSSLVKYLTKENGWDKSFFVDQSGNRLSPSAAARLIDSNTKHLKARNAKFHHLTINPSEEEIQALVEKAVGHKVDGPESLTDKERELVDEEMRAYAGRCMDMYAKHMNFPDVRDREDLRYIMMVEHCRKYKEGSPEVVSGQVAAGTPKPGWNLHVHVAVSAQDAMMRHVLNPSSRHRTRPDGTKSFTRNAWRAHCMLEFLDAYGVLDEAARQEGVKYAMQVMRNSITDAERTKVWKRNMSYAGRIRLMTLSRGVLRNLSCTAKAIARGDFLAFMISALRLTVILNNAVLGTALIALPPELRNNRKLNMDSMTDTDIINIARKGMER